MNSSFYLDDNSWLVLNSGQVNRSEKYLVSDAFPMRNISFVTDAEIKSLQESYDPELAFLMTDFVKVTDSDKIAFQGLGIQPFLWPAVKAWLSGTDISDINALAKDIHKSLLNINALKHKYIVHAKLLYSGTEKNKRLASHWYANTMCDFPNIEDALLNKDLKLRKIFETNYALAVPRYYIDYQRFEDGAPFFGLLKNYGYFNLPVIKSDDIYTWIAFLKGTNTPIMPLQAFITKPKVESVEYVKAQLFWNQFKVHSNYVLWMHELYPKLQGEYVVYQDFGVIQSSKDVVIPDSSPFIDWLCFSGYLSKTDIYSLNWDATSKGFYQQYRENLWPSI